MNEKDIFKALGEVDPKFISESAPSGSNAKRKGAPWIRLVAACVALLVLATVATLMIFYTEDDNVPQLPDDNESTEVPNDPTEYDDGIVNYVIYGDFRADSIPTFEGGDNYTLEAAPRGEKNFSISKRTTVERTEGAPDEISVRLNGKDVVLKYMRTLSNELVSNDKFAYLGICDEYRWGEETIEFNPNTKEVQFYVNTGVDKSIDGDFTDEQAKQEAEKILVELYGENALEYYTFEMFMSSDTEDTKTRSVLYVKKVFGYSSEDDVLIKFNRKGELISVNAKKRRTMEHAENDITQTQIEQAVAIMKKEYPKWNMTIPQLLIDAEGDYYLNIHLSLIDDYGYFNGWQAYINVK